MYAGGSVGLELEVTVPPWSGQDDLTFSFEPEELVGDHTRMVRGENNYSEREMGVPLVESL